MKNCLMIILILTGIIGCSQKKTPTDINEKTRIVYYCPMHPEVTAEKPGVCPICNMSLVKRTEKKSSDTAISPIHLSIDAHQQMLSNVSTIKVRKENFKKKISAYSYMDFAEQNQKIISGRFNGRIEKLFVSKTGDPIERGQALFEIYSPELIQAESEYLIARNNRNRPNEYNPLVEMAAKKRLSLYGYTNEQISVLDTSKTASLTFIFHAPLSGTVVEKNIQDGVYINEGQALYKVADLSLLWNIAEVHEQDLAFINVGDAVKVKMNAYPDEIFEGKIDFVYPIVNPQTRTVKIRSEFSNSKGKLKPQMFGELFLERNFENQLIIPEDAVLRTGRRNIVWVKSHDTAFEQREVILGMKSGGYFQILSGLNEGEEIVKNGGFLIDSESRLVQP